VRRDGVVIKRGEEEGEVNAIADGCGKEDTVCTINERGYRGTAVRGQEYATKEEGGEEE